MVLVFVGLLSLAACSDQLETPELNTAGTILTTKVAASSDDAEESKNGRMNLTGGDLDMVYDHSGNQTVGLRFRNLNLPKNAVINNVYVQFTASRASSTATSLLIKGEASGNAPAFSSAKGNLSSRVVTKAGVTWTPTAWTRVGEAGSSQKSPNLSVVVQEIVNQPTWAAGQALVLLVTGTGERVAQAFDGSTTTAPRLYVDYTVVSTTNQAPGVNAGSDQSVTLPSAAKLAGSASDDGLPSGTLTTKWSKVSGLGTVTFGSTTSLATTATFSAAGSYVLRLSASDGTLSSSDDLNVSVAAASSSTAVTIAAAGDIACDPASSSFNGGSGTSGSCHMKATADLLASITPKTVLTLGDNQYDSGTLSAFQKSYALSWGLSKSVTRPAVGNHEYQTSGASGYFQYFGSAAGDPGKGYYSYDVGAWHLVALNSNCSAVGGCGVGSAQEKWLRADLAAHPTACTLAYWHHPRFSSGEHGSNTFMTALWQALQDAGAEIVLSGHDHNYERFAPQTAGGTKDTLKGLRQFVVGTGGKSHYPVGSAITNSEARSDDTYGVLKLTLNASSYDWRFLPEAGKTFSDAGTAGCH